MLLQDLELVAKLIEVRIAQVGGKSAAGVREHLGRRAFSAGQAVGRTPSRRRWAWTWTSAQCRRMANTCLHALPRRWKSGQVQVFKSARW